MTKLKLSKDFPTIRVCLKSQYRCRDIIKVKYASKKIHHFFSLGHFAGQYGKLNYLN